jgi:hypothetical protein
MEKSLKEIDEMYNNQYNGLLNLQEQVLKQLKNYPFNLAKAEITQAVFG